MKRVLKRLTEMLVGCILLSLCIHIADFLGAIPRTNTGYCTAMLIGMSLYIAFLVNRLRRYWRRAYMRQHYYIKCYAAYGIFISIWLLVYWLFNNIFAQVKSVYSWLFCITRFAEYTNLGISAFVSGLLFHGIMLAVIALAPVRFNLYFLNYNPALRKRRKKKSHSRSKTK